MTYAGAPLRDGGDLLRRCCVPKTAPVQYLAATVSDRVAPPKEPLVLFSAKPETMQPVELAKLDAARAKIQARICYRSALDTCWVRDTTRRRPEEVRTCPIPKTSFGGGS